MRWNRETCLNCFLAGNSAPICKLGNRDRLSFAVYPGPVPIDINELYQNISEPEIRFLEKAYENDDEIQEQSAHSDLLNLSQRDGSIVTYQVHSMFFREGIFFVYIPKEQMETDVMDMFSQREKIINELLKHRMPSLVSLCVLVADLQDSVKICAELLPEEYFQLINQLWKTLRSTFDKYEGIHGKHAGDGMLYYFIKKPGTNYVMNAICCAMEIKEKVKVFNNEWEIKKGMVERYLHQYRNQ